MSSRTARTVRVLLAMTVLLSVLTFRFDAARISAVTPGPVFTHLAPEAWVSLLGPTRSDIESDGEFWVAEDSNYMVTKFSKEGRPLFTLGTGVRDTLYYPSTIDESMFGYPAGVAADSASGRVYVADRGTRYIRVFSSNGAIIRSWGVTSTLSPSVSAQPYGIDVGPDGNVYVGEYATAKVLHSYTPNGTILRTSPTVLSYLKDVAVCASGTVFAIAGPPSPAVQQATIYRFDPSPTDPKAFLAPVESVMPTPTAPESKAPQFTSIEMAPTGDIVLSDAANGRVVTYDPYNLPVEKDSWGSWVKADPAVLGTIIDGCIGPTGKYLTIQKSIVTLDRWTSYLSSAVLDKHFTPAGTAPGEFTSPTRSAVGTSALYVLDTGTVGKRLQRFNLDGTFVSEVLTATAATGLGLTPDGDLLVAGPGYIERRRPTGAIVTTLSTSPSLIAPSDLKVAADGSLVVADAGANAVFRFPATGGEPVATFTNGTAAPLLQPSGVTLLADGSMWIADTGNQRLQLLDSSGTPVTALGSPYSYGNQNGQFVNPTDVEVAADGSLWFTDTGNNRVGQYCFTTPYSSWHGADAQWWYTQFAASVSGVGPNKFKGPQGISITPSGALYICDTGSHHVMSSDILAPHSWGSSFSSAWTSGTPGVKFFASDDVTPTVKVRVNSGVAFDWSQDTTYSPTGEGSFDIEYYAVGVNGFEELPHNHALLRIDRTAPSELTIDGASEFWTNAATVPLTIAATDTVSSVQRLTYRIGSGPETTYSVPVAVDTEGVTTVTATAFDYAGNVKTASARVSLDRIPPSVTIDAPAQAQEPVAFSLSSSDQGAGVSFMQYRLDDDPVWHTGTLPSIVCSTGADETHIIRARAWDTVGNISSETTKAVLVEADTSPPSGVVTFAGGKRWVSDNTNISVVASVTDAMEMRLDSGTGLYGTWSPFARDIQFDLPAADGDYLVGLQLRDVVGVYTGRPENTYEVTAAVGVDRVDPHTDATADVDTVPRFIDAAAVTFDASDDRSGVGATHFVVDGGTVRTGSSVLISGEGDHSLEWWSVDNAGNEEPHHSRIVRIMRASSIATISVTPTVVTYPGVVTVSGSITDSVTGEPVPYSRVIVEYAPTVFGPWRPRASVSTDRNGSFSLTDKPVGRVVYRVRLQDTPIRKSAVALTGPVTVKAVIGRPVLPFTSLYAGKSFLTTALIRPAHEAARSRIVFRYYHDHGDYASGHPVWNLERTVSSRSTPVDASTARLSSQVALPSSGVWMVRVEHPVDAHPYVISAPRVFLVR